MKLTVAISQEEALWRAVGASPEDALPRLVLADYLDEIARTVECGCGGEVLAVCLACSGTGWVPDGRHEQADAMRATAGKVPRWFLHYQVWSWDAESPAEDKFSIGPELFAAMGTPQHRYWHDAPTAADAIRNLVRAWVSVNRSGGKG